MYVASPKRFAMYQELKMKEIIILLVLLVMFAITSESKPHFTEDEMINQIRSLRGDVVAARQFAHFMKAGKEMTARRTPWQTPVPFSSQANLQLVRDAEEAAPQRVLNEDILQRVRDFVNLKKARQSTHDTRKFQARFLAMIAGGKLHMRPGMQNPYSWQDRMEHVHVAMDPKDVRTQDTAEAAFLFDVPHEEMERLADIFKGHVFECITNATHELAESIRLSKDFNDDSKIIRMFLKFADIFTGAKFDRDTLQKFIDFMLDLLHPKGNRHKSAIATKQEFGSGFSRTTIEIIKTFAKLYNSIAPKLVKDNNGIFGSILSVIPVLLDDKPSRDSKRTLNSSINTFINYSLKILDGFDFLNTDTRKAFREVTKIVIPAYLKALSGETLSADDRSRLIRSYVKLFVSFNEGTNSSLLRLAREFLNSSNTSGDLDPKSKQLFSHILLNLLEPLFNKLAHVGGKTKVPLVSCVLGGLQDISKSLLTYLPKRSSTALSRSSAVN